MVESCISSKALSNPFKIENKLRAQILKNMILALSVKGGEDVMMKNVAKNSYNF